MNSRLFFHECNRIPYIASINNPKMDTYIGSSSLKLSFYWLLTKNIIDTISTKTIVKELNLIKLSRVLFI